MLGALCAAAALLLVASGILKLRNPAASRAAARSLLRGRAARWTSGAAVRAVATGEFAAGVSFLAIGGVVPAAAVAVAFAGFTGVTIAMLAAGQRASCGCFGRADAPVGLSHTLVNAACCVAGLACVVEPVGALGGVLAARPAIAAVAAAQIVVLAGLGYLALTAWPALTARRRALELR
jgi:hypothetical protein